MIKTPNPHQYQIIYLAETDFGRFDLYRQLALKPGLEPTDRRAQLWREIKQHITGLVEQKNSLPVWIIDEGHNLPLAFYRDFPSFLNFAFDSRNLITVWLIDHPQLAQILGRAPYAELASRIQVKETLTPIAKKERFTALIHHAFTEASSPQLVLDVSETRCARRDLDLAESPIGANVFPNVLS